MKIKQPAVYIVASKMNGTLYTGVTSDLLRRITEHKNDLVPGFASKYNCKILVWYYLFETMTDAIHAEKLIKRRSRLYKIKLIESLNVSWCDLYKDLFHQ